MSAKKGLPWVTFGIALGLVVFYSVWLTHSYHWNSTPLDAVVATALTPSVPLATIYVLTRLVSWILRKPFEQWSTEEYQA